MAPPPTTIHRSGGRRAFCFSFSFLSGVWLGRQQLRDLCSVDVIVNKRSHRLCFGGEPATSMLLARQRQRAQESQNDWNLGGGASLLDGFGQREKTGRHRFLHSVTTTTDDPNGVFPDYHSGGHPLPPLPPPPAGPQDFSSGEGAYYGGGGQLSTSPSHSSQNEKSMSMLSKHVRIGGVAGAARQELLQQHHQGPSSMPLPMDPSYYAPPCYCCGRALATTGDVALREEAAVLDRLLSKAYVASSGAIGRPLQRRLAGADDRSSVAPSSSRDPEGGNLEGRRGGARLMSVQRSRWKH